MKNKRENKIQSLSKKIDMYREEVLNRNYKNFKSFAFGGMILTGGIALVAFVCYGRMAFFLEYAILFTLFVICNLYIHLFLKNHVKYAIQSFYIMMLPILAIGILMGTFLDTTSNAMTIMIMLCTLFMFITDKPQHVIGYIFGAAIVFLACSYACKELDLFVSDTVNLVIYLSVGVSVNMLTLKDRVESVENYTLAIKRADSDTLTSILNRGAGDSVVKQMLARGEKGAFIIADIDDFKHINDSWGHQIGDEVIRKVSQQLKTTFRNDDVVWRLGGDEFAVFAVNLEDKELCERRLAQVQDGVSRIQISQTEIINIKLSMGCSICRTDDCEFDFIYKNSDEALYKAKQQGKNKYVIREI